MCIYSPMPHTLSYCALIGKCALIRSNTVLYYYVYIWCTHWETSLCELDKQILVRISWLDYVIRSLHALYVPPSPLPNDLDEYKKDRSLKLPVQRPLNLCF